MTLRSSVSDGRMKADALPTLNRYIGGWRSTALQAAISTALLCGGCGQAPQFSAKDQRLLEALRTAISAHKPEWLEASAKKIDEAHQQGSISDEGFEALQSAIVPARAADWKQAEKLIIRLEKAQRPPAK